MKIRQTFKLGLSNDHPVKGIAVMRRQAADVLGMSHFDRQRQDRVFGHLVGMKASGLAGRLILPRPAYAGSQKEGCREVKYTREKQTLYFDTMLDHPAFLPSVTEPWQQ